MRPLPLTVSLSKTSSMLTSTLDLDDPDLGFVIRTRQKNSQQSIFQRGRFDFDALGQDEGTQKLSGGDAPVKERFGFRLILPALDHQLAVLDRHRDIVPGKARHRQSDGDAAIGSFLDIIRRIAIAAAFGGTLQKPLQRLEAQEERVVEKAVRGHLQSPPRERLLLRWPHLSAIFATIEVVSFCSGSRADYGLNRANPRAIVTGLTFIICPLWPSHRQALLRPSPPPAASPRGGGGPGLPL